MELVLKICIAALFILLFLSYIEAFSRNSSNDSKKITIKTADEWNSFAKEFNAKPSNYTNPLNIVIAGRLDFDGKVFTPLYTSFNGTIKGLNKWSNDRLMQLKEQRDLSTFSDAAEFNGFYNINNFENIKGKPVKSYWIYVPDTMNEYLSGRMEGYDESKYLFGIHCNNLSIQNLSFVNIDSKNLNSLFAQSINYLNLKNVEIKNCHLSEGHSLLAINTGDLIIDSLFVNKLSIDGREFADGLIRTVANKAEFKNVCIFNANITPRMDLAGSGRSVATIGILANTINGKATYDTIELFRCWGISLNTLALSEKINILDSVKNIKIEQCTFNSDNPRIKEGYGLLFGKVNSSTKGEKISFIDSTFNSYENQRFYENLGYTFKNCIILPIDKD